MVYEYEKGNNHEPEMDRIVMKTALFILSMLLLTGCAHTLDKFRKAEGLATLTYFNGGNMEEAEQALLKFRLTLLEYKKANFKKMNPDFELIKFDARLYSLYEYKGDHESAQKYFIEGIRSCKNCYPTNTPTNLEAQTKLIDFFNQMEARYNAIRWKHEQANAQGQDSAKRSVIKSQADLVHCLARGKTTNELVQVLGNPDWDEQWADENGLNRTLWYNLRPFPARGAMLGYTVVGVSVELRNDRLDGWHCMYLPKGVR